MKYRNGLADAPRVLDMLDQGARSEGGCCAVCSRLLPRGFHQRVYCLVHSAYPQLLIRRERRRRCRYRSPVPVA
jgi:hypothetical protein